MRKIEIEYKAEITVRQCIDITDDGLAELDKLSEGTVVNSRKYIDRVTCNDLSINFNTTKAYNLIKDSTKLSGHVNGYFDEIFYKEVEP